LEKIKFFSKNILPLKVDRGWAVSRPKINTNAQAEAKRKSRTK